MSKSPIMSHDENKRQEFKDKTLRRVYAALNATVKVRKTSVPKEFVVKGLLPKSGGEE